MATMTVCRYMASEAKVELVSVPTFTNPKPGHVTVKVAYGGICGTDLTILAGNLSGIAIDGVILGHEISGTIHKVGEGVKTLKIGDRVVLDPAGACDGCRFCHRGRPNLCLVEGLKSAFGVSLDGGWAEFCDIRAAKAIPLPDSLSHKQAVLCEPMSCVMRAWNQMGNIPADAKVLVMGAGISGLLFASLFHYRGYRDITVTSRTEKRRKMAELIGLNLKITSLEAISAGFTKPDDVQLGGFDVIIEATGSEVALETAFPWLRNGGKMILYGVYSHDKSAKISPFDILMKEIQIIGTWVSCYSFADAVAIIKAMSEVQYLKFEKLSIQIFPYTKVNDALDLLKNKDITKAVLEF